MQWDEPQKGSKISKEYYQKKKKTVRNINIIPKEETLPMRKYLLVIFKLPIVFLKSIRCNTHFDALFKKL